MSLTSAARIDRDDLVVTLSLLGLSAGTAASFRLDSVQAQNVWLAALCCLLAPRLVVDSNRQQSAVVTILSAAGLAIAAHTFGIESTSMQATVLALLGAATILGIDRDRRDQLIPGSVVALLLMLTLHALFDQPFATPAIALSAGATAAIAAGAFLTRFDARYPASWAPSLCLLAASVGAAVVAIEGTPLWITAVTLTIGATVLIDASAPPAPQLRHPIDRVPNRPDMLWALTGSGVAIAALTAAATSDTDLLWPLSGAVGVGMAGLTSLAAQWQLANDRQRRRLQQAAGESRTDALTGAFNRRGIDERLLDELARAHRFEHPLSLLLIDLDDFKSINDRQGHAAGDDALRVIAQMIEQSIRTIDAAGRFGGEEFLVILPETAMPGAEAVAERIRSTIEHSGPVTVSIGLASLARDVQTSSELIAQADAALYFAKRTGKNRLSLAV